MTIEYERHSIESLAGHPVIDLTNLVVEEQRRNENVTGKIGMAEELIQNLTAKFPNRLYCSENGFIARVLLFSEYGLPYRVYMETCKPGNNDWQKIKSETITCTNTNDLERQIDFWRRKFGMSKDLFEKPSMVIQISEDTPFGQGEFVNLILDQDMQVLCHYVTEARNVRVLNIDCQSNFEIKSGQSMMFPPMLLQQWSHPFNRRQESKHLHEFQ